LSPSAKKIPLALSLARKELPPPGKIFKSKKAVQRKRSKEQLRQEIKESLKLKSS